MCLGKRLLHCLFHSNSHGNGHTDHGVVTCAQEAHHFHDQAAFGGFYVAAQHVLHMAGVFSQLELSMIRARVRSGMENAKAKGKQIGRPQVTADDVPSGFLRHYPAYKRGQLNVSELARVCNISRTTAYKYINLLES